MSRTKPNTEGPLSRKEDFVEAALRLFSKQGYAATSTRHICAELNLAHSAIYNYFATKEDVLYEIVIRSQAQFQEGFDEILERYADRSPYERLKAAVRYTLGRALHTRVEWQVLSSQLRFLQDKRYRRDIVSRRDHFEEQFRNLLEEGAELGYWRQTDAKLTGYSIFGICDGLSNWYRPDGPLTAEQILDHNVDFILTSLCATPTPSPASRSKRRSSVTV